MYPFPLDEGAPDADSPNRVPGASTSSHESQSGSVEGTGSGTAAGSGEEAESAETAQGAVAAAAAAAVVFAATAEPAVSRDADYVAPKLEVASWQVPLLDVIGALTRHLTLVAVICGLGVLKAYKGVKGSVPFYMASSVAILLPREKPILDATVDTGSLETTQDVARRAPSASLTLPPNTDLYVTLLKSYPTMEAIADRFESELIGMEGMPEDHRAPERVAQVRRMVAIAGTDDGLLTVSVKSKNAQLAADLANALIAESESCSKGIERQLVLQQALFLDEAREKLAEIVQDGEETYSAFTREHGVLGVEFDITQRISQAQQMRKSADGSCAELSALLRVRTAESSTVQQLKAKIRRLDEEADAIYAEIGLGESAEVFGRLQLERQALEQIVRFRRDLHMTVTAQADIFRIRAEQPTGGMAVVRRAVVPHIPAGPSKKGIVGMALAGAIFLAVLSVIVLEQLTLIKRTDALHVRFGAISGNLRNWFPIRAGLYMLAQLVHPLKRAVVSLRQRRSSSGAS